MRPEGNDSGGPLEKPMKKNVCFQIAIALFSISLFIGCSEKRQVRETFYPDGKLQEQYYVALNAKGAYVRDGLYTWWYENGKKRQEGFYRNGVQHGVGSTWYETGEKEYDISAKYGQLDGVCTTWYKNGRKKEEGTWKQGELIKAVRWDESGSVIR
jgi:antitoxin component YwqK of YwqJK toxin-antitoxin module